MARRSLAALLLLACLARAGVGANVRVGQDGRLAVAVEGKQEISAGLFLWYDEWIWRSPGALERERERRWSGAMSKRPEDGAGRIEFVRSARRMPGGLRVSYELRRRGDIDLTGGVFLAFFFPLGDYEGHEILFSHGPPRRLGQRFQAAARACTVRLTEDLALEIALPEATVFSSDGADGPSAMLRLRLAPEDFGRNARARLELRIVPAPADGRLWRALPRQGGLRVGRVTSDRRVADLHAPVEFTVGLSATYDNPFDPDDVAVEAKIRRPSGRVDAVPGFYHQGFGADYEKGLELVRPLGEPTWKVRYTPRETGRHEVTVSARDRSGRASSSPMEVWVRDSRAPGFARAGRPGPGRGRYFRTDSGRTLFLIGHNVTTYVGDLDRVFARMERGGENYTRFWMWSRGLGLEWDGPAGRYRLDQAWRLDRTLELARRHGIYVMLCFDTHQDFGTRWDLNPYNAAQGGPCPEPMDFFTDERAKQLYRKRLRYVVARWGHHPNLLCWELLNEAEGWQGAQENREAVAAWHAEMARHLRELDPFGHPITSSVWTTEGWPELWELPQMDFVQSHFYARSDWADMAGEVAAICAQKRRDYPDRLHVFGEYGITGGRQTRRMDPRGVHLHNGNWAALMSGAASNPVSWWHRDYIDPMDLYGVYRGLARFAEGERLADRAWQPVTVPEVAYRGPSARTAAADLVFTGTASGWDRRVPSGTRFVLRRDGVVENVELLPTHLHGDSHATLRSELVFGLDAAEATRFAVHVDTVSAGAALEFRLDGEPVRSVELPADEGLGKGSEWQEQWGIWQTRYDEWFGIEVPAGVHEVALANAGRDWIRIGSFEVEGYVRGDRPRLRVLGLASGDRAILWVQNRAHTWFNVREGRPIPPVDLTTVTLSGLADGRWEVQTWDTAAGVRTGRQAAIGRNGRLGIDLPVVETDLALKLVRRTGL